MNVQVMSLKDAVKYSYRPHDSESAVVSIRTPWACYEGNNIYPSNANKIKSVLRVWFDDIESGTNCMDADHAKAIKQFIQNHLNRNIIVQCDAGVSRSAGVAAALMKYYNDDDTPIFDNPKYCPNMLCYRTMLNVLMDE